VIDMPMSHWHNSSVIFSTLIELTGLCFNAGISPGIMTTLAKLERYQAEALVFKHCPINALLGVVCYTDQSKKLIDQEVTKRSLKIDVRSIPNWYF